MSEKDTTYNGWTNYETWAVALWIDNEQGTQYQAQELALAARREGPSHVNVKLGIWGPGRAGTYLLIDALKTWVSDELLPDLGATLAADLLGAAVSEVNWHELAEHYFEDLPNESEDEADEEARS